MSEEHQNPDWEVVDSIYAEFAEIVNKYREFGIKTGKPLTFPEIDLVLWKMKLFRDQQFLELYMQQMAHDQMNGNNASGQLPSKSDDSTSMYK